MKRTLILAVALLVLVASSAFASWTTELRAVGTSQYLELITDATFDSSLNLWHWTYDVTPMNGADKVVGFTITFQSSEILPGVIDQYGPKQDSGGTWTPVSSWTTSNDGINKLYWQWNPIPAGNPANLSDKLNAGETFRFGYYHANGPATSALASAQDDFGFSGPTYAPIPEASTIMLGVMGLSSLMGIRRLKK